MPMMCHDSKAVVSVMSLMCHDSKAVISVMSIMCHDSKAVISIFLLVISLARNSPKILFVYSIRLLLR